MNYVAGFLIDPGAETVALVRKGKPEWQRGKLNGVGGKIEPGETPPEAMRREFREEAGLDVTSWDWFATVDGPWGAVYFFRAFNEATPRTMEAEPIEMHALGSLPYDECIPNLSWLIPLARYTHDYYAPVVASERVCTCPSGDGSLRWPCPMHPPTHPTDPEPQPTDGPDYHAEHAAWRARTHSTEGES